MKMILGAVDGYTRSTFDLVVDRDRSAFRFTITGTHAGDLPGLPATGRPVEIGGAMHVVVRDGECVSAIEILDHDSLCGLSLR